MIEEEATRLYAIVSSRLRDARRAKSISQEEIAVLIGVRRASVANFERGKQRFPLHTIYDYARAVGAPIAELLPSLGELSVPKPAPSIVRWESGGHVHNLSPEHLAFLEKMIERNEQ